MSGRVKQKVYQYDIKGKFIQEFESEAEAARKYYGDKRPLFQIKNYHLTSSVDILVKERIGRSAIKILFRKINSPFITSAATKPVECLNLNNEIIAVYKNAHLASLLSGIDRTTIDHQLKTGKSTNKDLFFRYKL